MPEYVPVMTALNKTAFIIAMQVPMFQYFMTKTVKVSDHELKKLRSCASCIGNFKWRPKTIDKINAKLQELLETGVIKVIEKKPFRMNNFTCKYQAIDFINNLENPEIIQIRHR